MDKRSFFKSCLVLALASFMFVTLAGCDGRPRRVPVTGKVLVDGKSLQEVAKGAELQGYVRFMPVAGGRSAQAALDSEGKFVLGNYEATDGCPLGEYQVEIQAVEMKGGRMRYLVPPRYGDAKKSGLVVKIEKSEQVVELATEWLPADAPWRKKYIVLE